MKSSEKTSRSFAALLAKPTFYAVGGDIGGTEGKFSLIRYASRSVPEVIDRCCFPTGPNCSPQDVLPFMADLIRKMLISNNVGSNSVGLGLSIAGIRSKTGAVLLESANLPHWRDVPVRRILEKKLSLHVRVGHDAKLAGLSEYLWGAGSASNNMVYLTISTGIGGGIFVGRKLYKGSSGNSGELGHLTVDTSLGICNCGNIGCLELGASGGGVAKQASVLIESGKADSLRRSIRGLVDDEFGLSAPFEITGKYVSKSAELGDPVAQELIEQAGKRLGMGLVSIVHAFNPDTVVYGGGFSQSKRLMESALSHVNEYCMRPLCSIVKFSPAHFGSNSGVIGAGAWVCLS